MVDKTISVIFFILPLVMVFVSCSENKLQSFDEKGNLKQEYEVNEEGQPNGQLKEFDEDGRLILTGEYVNGYRNGEFILYDNSGNIVKSKQYYKDSLKKVITFHSNGNKKTVSTWKGGKNQSLKVQRFTREGETINYYPEYEVSMPDSIFVMKKTYFRLEFKENHRPDKLLLGTMDNEGFLNKNYSVIPEPETGIFEFEFRPVKHGHLQLKLIALYHLEDKLINGVEILIEYESFEAPISS
jgi:hypothetical protein